MTKFVSIGGHAGPLPVPWLVPSFLVVIAVMSVVLARTPFGRRLYAVGSNPQAAPLALIAPRARLDHDLRPERAVRRGGRRAAARLHRLGLRRRRPALSVPDHRCRGDRRHGAGRRPRRLHRNAAGALVLTEINTLLIGLGLSPAMVQAALGVLIVVLVSLYGREPHVRATI